jgi:Domain of unknown function (DUF4157)/Protein of unknown function (DUF3626)
MLAVAERTAEQEPARAVEAQHRPPQQNGVHGLQRSVGNRAVGRALQRHARGAGLVDPAEVEAERNAAAVLGASGLGPSPRRCACGGLVLGGGECARCRAERLQRREPGGDPAGGAVQPTPAVDRVLAMPGRPLDGGLRSAMEPQIGADFGGVRVHTGPEAGEAARSVGAEAFTSGTDVVFGEGKFAPEAAEGRRLLAHELTHVRQQAGGERQIARAPLGGGSWEPEYEDFKKRVFAMATSRLKENDAKLDEWRTFIDSRFDDLELRAQMTATESEGLIQTAYAGHRIEYLEPYFGAKSPATRKFNESVINHEINGGCGACHAAQIVWRWNAEHYREFEDLPTTAQMLTKDADYAAFQRTMRGELPVANYVDATAFGTPTAPAAPLQFAPLAPTPTPAAPAPAEAPATIVYPKPRSDLCGPLPAAEEMPTIPAASLGPNTALAVEAITRIHPVLQPLGPQGYRVLPAHIFTDLRDKSPAALRTMVMDSIAARQAGYRWHVNKIAAGDEEYYELCPIVDELLPTVSAMVQAVVHYEIDVHRFWQAVLEFLQDLMVFLMIVFPPSAFVLGPSLAVLQVATGYEDVKQGSLEKAGIGAGIYAPQVEAAAESRVFGGWMKIVTGSIGLATSGFAITSKMLAKRVPTAMAPAPRMGSGLFTPLQDGSYMALHPQNPNWVVMQEGSMLRAGPMIDGEFHPIFQAEAPWGNAPPPGTPTWAEYSAGWGGGTGGGTGGAVRWNLSPSRALPAGPAEVPPTSPPVTPAGPVVPTRPVLPLGPGPRPAPVMLYDWAGRPGLYSGGVEVPTQTTSPLVLGPEGRFPPNPARPVRLFTPQGDSIYFRGGGRTPPVAGPTPLYVRPGLGAGVLGGKAPVSLGVPLYTTPSELTWLFDVPAQEELIGTGLSTPGFSRVGLPEPVPLWASPTESGFFLGGRQLTGRYIGPQVPQNPAWRAAAMLARSAEWDWTASLYSKALPEYLAEANARVAQLVENAQVRVRAPVASVTEIVRSGRLLTQFETGTTGGLLDLSARRSVEAGLFGTPLEAGGAQRPIYGYLSGTQELTTAQYGDVVLELKPAVRARTTFTFGDSLDETARGMQPNVAGEPLTRPTALAAQVGTDPLQLGSLADVRAGAAPYRVYTEAQVHGGVTLADVQEVVFTNGVIPSADVRAALEAAGIPWRMVPGPTP